MKESIIKWQTGEPTEEGRYIVTMIDGFVSFATFTPTITPRDVEFFKEYVLAWCPLNEIEPYKEGN